jgi:cell division protein FtsZ
MSDLKFTIEEETLASTRIKVVGVGGGGSNAVARMISAGLTGLDFYALNTDVQALNASPVPNKLAIGGKLTNGLGAGSDPNVGRQAALEDTERIVEALEGANMVFVTAGLGGGTGTGAAPVVASLAKELGALTVAVVTKPFAFEGARRKKAAERGLAELAATVDTVITIPNDRLLQLAPKGTSFFQAFKMADDVLHQAVQGISDIITTPGLINRDFSDIRSIMLGMGHAIMGTASARGEGAAVNAARTAIESPLMEAGGVTGARGILINITASSQLGIHEVNEACELIREATANEDVQINFGVVLDESLDDEVRITVIATGFHRDLPTDLLKPIPVPEPKIVEQPRAEDSFFAPRTPVQVHLEPDVIPQAAVAEAPPPPPAGKYFEVPPVYAQAAAVAPPPPPPPVAKEEPARPYDDLDVPALFRRGIRSMYQ